jgi:hypothetical protein
VMKGVASPNRNQAIIHGGKEIEMSLIVASGHAREPGGPSLMVTRLPKLEDSRRPQRPCCLSETRNERRFRSARNNRHPITEACPRRVREPVAGFEAPIKERRGRSYRGAIILSQGGSTAADYHEQRRRAVAQTYMAIAPPSTWISDPVM